MELRKIYEDIENEENIPIRSKCTPMFPIPSIFKNIKLEMFYDDQMKFSSCFPPKTGSTNWLKTLIKEKHDDEIDVEKLTTKDIFYDLSRFERKELKTEFERKTGVNNFVSFITVRHPFDRLLSAYRNRY